MRGVAEEVREGQRGVCGGRGGGVRGWGRGAQREGEVVVPRAREVAEGVGDGGDVGLVHLQVLREGGGGRGTTRRWGIAGHMRGNMGIRGLGGSGSGSQAIG